MKRLEERLSRRGFLGTAVMLASVPLTLYGAESPSGAKKDSEKKPEKEKLKEGGKPEKLEILKPLEPEPDIETLDSYKAEIVYENPGYIGEIKYNPENKRLYFVRRENGEEDVFSIGFKDGKLDDSGLKQEFKSVLKFSTYFNSTKIALDRTRGNFFIFQDNGEEDNIRVYDKDGKLAKELKNPYRGDAREPKKATDIAVNPLNGNLYAPVWSTKRVDCLDISGDFSPKPFFHSGLYLDFITFDSNGVMYLGKSAQFLSLEKSVRIEKIGKKTERFSINLQKIVEAEDLDEYVEEGFSLEHIMYGKNEFLLAGSVGHASSETGIVLSVDSQLKKASLVAKVSEYLIGGMDTGEPGEIYISIQPWYYPHKKTGKILRVSQDQKVPEKR